MISFRFATLHVVPDVSRDRLPRCRHAARWSIYESIKVGLGVSRGNALLAYKSKVESHLCEIFDSHRSIVLEREGKNGEERGVGNKRYGYLQYDMLLTTDKKDRAMASNTLLLASSG